MDDNGYMYNEVIEIKGIWCLICNYLYVLIPMILVYLLMLLKNKKRQEQEK